MSQAQNTRRFTLKALTVATALGAFGLSAHAQETIKVGVLHSLSGTMAISETVLKDVALMAIDEINAKGGVLGKKLEPIVVDPASNWPLFAEKARQLIAQDKVAVTFGCWTSVSRKSVLPVFAGCASVVGSGGAGSSKSSPPSSPRRRPLSPHQSSRPSRLRSCARSSPSSKGESGAQLCNFSAASADYCGCRNWLGNCAAYSRLVYRGRRHS